jgi:hypothetical protein
MASGATGVMFGRNMWLRPLDQAVALTRPCTRSWPSIRADCSYPTRQSLRGADGGMPSRIPAAGEKGTRRCVSINTPRALHPLPARKQRHDARQRAASFRTQTRAAALLRAAQRRGTVQGVQRQKSTANQARSKQKRSAAERFQAAQHVACTEDADRTSTFSGDRRAYASDMVEQRAQRRFGGRRHHRCSPKPEDLLAGDGSQRHSHTGQSHGRRRCGVWSKVRMFDQAAPGASSRSPNLPTNISPNRTTRNCRPMRSRMPSRRRARPEVAQDAWALSARTDRRPARWWPWTIGVSIRCGKPAPRTTCRCSCTFPTRKRFSCPPTNTTSATRN